jgi:hypothetical protein
VAQTSMIGIDLDTISIITQIEDGLA